MTTRESADTLTPSLVEGRAARDDVLRLVDGRVISYRLSGDPQGLGVIALHGTPGARTKFSVADVSAEALGLRLIAPDRWGYGGTSPHPKPSLSAFADDIAALADHLGCRRFAVMGVSGGGPYATAVAARLGDRVSALALVAPVGPMTGQALAGLRPFHRFCFGPLGRSPRAVSAIFRGLRGLLSVSHRAGLAVAMATVPAADRRVLATPGVRGRLAATFALGLAPGSDGPVTDLTIFSAPWDVDPGAIRTPARLWIGSADRNVPISAALALAEAIPACSVQHLEGAGHLWVALNYPAVLGWLAEASQTPR